MDIVSLGFGVESEELKKGSTELNKLTAAAKKAEDAVVRMAGVTQDVAKKIGVSLSDATKRAEGAATAAFNRIGTAATGAASLVSSMFSSAMKHVERIMMGLGAAAGVALALVVRKIQPIEGEIATVQDYLSAAWDAFSTKAAENLQGVVHWTLETAANIVQSFQYAFDQTSTLWNRLPGAIAEAMTNAANRVISGVENMVNTVVGSVNHLLELANKIPGVNVGQIGSADFGRLANPNAGAAAGLSAELAANSEVNANRNLFDEWGAAANARAWASSTTVKESNGKDRLSEYERLQKSITRQVEAMKIEAATYGMSTSAAAQYRTEQELMRAAIESGVPITGELVEANRRLAESLADVTAQADGMRILEDLRTPAELFNNEMTRLDGLLNRGVLSWEQYENAAAKAAERAGNTWSQASDQIASAMQMVVDASGSSNKTLMRITQSAALARAIINVHEGVTRALTLPFPANLAAAATVAAQGFASVNAIRSMSKSSSIAPGGAATARTSTTTEGLQTARQEKGKPRQTVHIILQGSRYSREDVQELIASMQDAVNDGVSFVTDPR